MTSTVHHLEYSTVLLWLHSEHQFMHHCYKTQVILYILRWGQPSIWIYFQNNPLFPKKTLFVTQFVPTYSHQQAQSVLYQHTYQPFALLFCYILFPRPQSSWVLFLSNCTSGWVTTVTQSQNIKSLVNYTSSNKSSSHGSFWSRVTAGFVCLIQSRMEQRSFSCISAEACSGSTPCVPAGRWCSLMSTRSWVWKFWRHGPRWCRSACTRPSGNKGRSWCGRGRSWPLEREQFMLTFSWSLQLTETLLQLNFCECVHLESAVVEKHHEGAVRFEPLQQVESGHVCVCHTTEVPALGKQRS